MECTGELERVEKKVRGRIPLLVFFWYRQRINESAFYEEASAPAIQPVSNVVK